MQTMTTLSFREGRRKHKKCRRKNGATAEWGLIFRDYTHPNNKKIKNNRNNNNYNIFFIAHQRCSHFSVLIRLLRSLVHLNQFRYHRHHSILVVFCKVRTVSIS